VASSCDPGSVRSEALRGACAACVVGRFADTRGFCSDCSTGSYADTNGLTACKGCARGTFLNSTGGTSCLLCNPGEEAFNTFEHVCAPCQKGTFGSDEGNPVCEQCPPGSFSTEFGSTACDLCPAGKIGTWGSLNCSSCEVGTFKENAGTTACKQCPKGTDCTNVDQFPSNKANWFTFGLNQTGERLWVPCVQEGFCLAQLRCAEGHMGPLCSVCAPDYSKGSRMDAQACLPCPHWALNVFISIVFAVVVMAAIYKITDLSIQSASKAKAITSALLKLLINYVTTMSVMSTVAMEVVASFSNEVDEVGEDGSMDIGLSSLAASFDWENSLSYFRYWAPHCLFLPGLTPRQKELISVLVGADHIQQIALENAASREALRDYHRAAELRRLLGSSLVPILLAGMLLLSGAILFIGHLRCFATSYRVTAFRVSNSKHVDHFDLNNINYNFLGVWPPVKYVNTPWTKRAFWDRFFRDSKPLVVVSTFITYTFVVRALLRPLRCRRVLPEDVLAELHGGSNFVSKGATIMFAPDVRCYESDSWLFWMSIVSSLLVGFGVPAFAAWRIYKRIQGAGFDVRGKRAWGFLIGGYESHLAHWECFVLFRKTICVLLALIDLSIGIRVLLFLFASTFFSVMHIWYQPFDNRFNELLDRIETTHLMSWGITTMLLMAMILWERSSGPRESSPEFSYVALSGMAVLHVTFIAVLVRQVVIRSRNSYVWDKVVQMRRVEGMMVYAEDCVHDQFGRLHRVASSSFVRYQASKPYIAVNEERLWVSLIATHSNIAELPMSSPDISLSSVQNPLVHLGSPVHPKEKHGRTLLKIVFDAASSIMNSGQHETLPYWLLEFIFRVGFTFDAQGDFRFTVARQGRKSQDPEGAGWAHGSSFRSRMRTVVHAVNSVSSASVRLAKSSRSQASSVGQTSEECMACGGHGCSICGLQPEERRMQVSISDEPSEPVGARISSAGSRPASPSSEKKLARLDSNSDAGKVVDMAAMKNYVEWMFDPEIFQRGLPLQDFQLNVSKLTVIPKHDLNAWLDLFGAKLSERRFQKNNPSRPPSPPASRSMMSICLAGVGEWAHAEVQTGEDSSLFFPAPQPLLGSSSEDPPASKRVLRWERLVFATNLQADIRGSRLPALAALRRRRLEQEAGLARVLQAETGLKDSNMQIVAVYDKISEDARARGDKLFTARRDFRSAQTDLLEVQSEVRRLQVQLEQRTPSSASRGGRQHVDLDTGKTFYDQAYGTKMDPQEYDPMLTAENTDPEGVIPPVRPIRGRPSLEETPIVEEDDGCDWTNWVACGGQRGGDLISMPSTPLGEHAVFPHGNGRGESYIVDNSVLRATTRGLGYRLLPNIEARDESVDGIALAFWGEVVVGTLHTDDWLKVGQRFLPVTVNGVTVLRPMLQV